MSAMRETVDRLLAAGLASPSTVSGMSPEEVSALEQQGLERGALARRCEHDPNLGAHRLDRHPQGRAHRRTPPVGIAERARPAPSPTGVREPPRPRNADASRPPERAAGRGSRVACRSGRRCPPGCPGACDRRCGAIPAAPRANTGASSTGSARRASDRAGMPPGIAGKAALRAARTARAAPRSGHRARSRAMRTRR
jgi:hypothetical protein